MTLTGVSVLEYAQRLEAAGVDCITITKLIDRWRIYGEDGEHNFEAYGQKLATALDRFWHAVSECHAAKVIYGDGGGK